MSLRLRFYLRRLLRTEIGPCDISGVSAQIFLNDPEKRWMDAHCDDGQTLICAKWQFVLLMHLLWVKRNDDKRNERHRSFRRSSAA